ncbi:TetR family transcriptional regulator [Streptomyces sp. 3MP-14]|uniref:TetR family transcriptional regulator n=1 Tax=Streptomyces mimosae TaxID=2586635 RepID=A0A5N6ATA9_9ACTN|nr:MULTISPECIES: TetR/AcrR family transcriptional regulator [Streptomyces]KAB8171150.1 TetR family transcriptional regulator [Streptomyces mimosae]KAB8179498.1 TetR family transcriptional regulator [Streptomyces sp. 3MP-14]
MPTARESLLEAARTAVDERPWPLVRMVEVAASAGVSRQTLYNEFGDKAGLGRALTDHRVTGFLEAFREHCARRAADAGDPLADAADWIVRTARADRLVRASLTGCRCTGMPPADQQPGRLVAELRERALRALAPHTAPPAREELPDSCETAIRLAISRLIAPPDQADRSAERAG